MIQMLRRRGILQGEKLVPFPVINTILDNMQERIAQKKIVLPVRGAVPPPPPPPPSGTRVGPPPPPPGLSPQKTSGEEHKLTDIYVVM
jgi:hypothetical protein